MDNEVEWHDTKNNPNINTYPRIFRQNCIPALHDIPHTSFIFSISIPSITKSRCTIKGNTVISIKTPQCITP